jgi:hypothetical protein
MLTRLLDRSRLDTLTPEGERAVARFRNIVIHDGSSFAVKAALQTTFPGRFTMIEPAAVEVHATYSGFADEVCAVHVAPDKDAERPFLPAPAPSHAARGPPRRSRCDIHARPAEGQLSPRPGASQR